MYAYPLDNIPIPEKIYTVSQKNAPTLKRYSSEL